MPTYNATIKVEAKDQADYKRKMNAVIKLLNSLNTDRLETVANFCEEKPELVAKIEASLKDPTQATALVQEFMAEKTKNLASKVRNLF